MIERIRTVDKVEPTIQHSGVTCLNYTYFNSNKQNFIIHSIYNLTLLSFTLLFGNILLELFVFKSASVNFYILLNLFLSGKFLIISYSRADGSTDGRTYVSNRPNNWMKIKKTIYKNPASCHTVLSFVFLVFLQGVSIILLLLGFYFVRLEPSSSDRTEQEKHERKKKYWLCQV